jgi:hypothetical protein
VGAEFGDFRPNEGETVQDYYQNNLPARRKPYFILFYFIFLQYFLFFNIFTVFSFVLFYHSI